MSDRISALHAEIQSLHANSLPKAPNPKAQKTAKVYPSTNPNTASEDPVTAQLRLDLAESLRSKGVAEVRLRTAEEELDKLRNKTRVDAKNIRHLESERSSLTRKLKDRDHELREKRKLLEVRWFPGVTCAGITLLTPCSNRKFKTR